MSNENPKLNLNINGQIQKIDLQKDMNLEALNNEKVKRALSIFDDNKDGVLQDTEINRTSVFNRGTFSVSNNSQIVDYYETDENKNVNYSASWYHDEEGNLVASTRDDDGDGFVDRAFVPYDKETNTMADIDFDNNKDMDGTGFTNKEGNRVLVARAKDTSVGRLLNVEEGVNDYITYGMALGTVSNDGELSIDLDLDGKPDSELGE